jgi:hypothetical protein
MDILRRSLPTPSSPILYLLPVFKNDGGPVRNPFLEQETYTENRYSIIYPLARISLLRFATAVAFDLPGSMNWTWLAGFHSSCAWTSTPFSKANFSFLPFRG